MLDADDWAFVAAVCQRHDLFLVYDAAMEALLFDGRAPVWPLDVPGMEERTVIVGSMSKAYRMIGWRVGWVAGPAAVVGDAGWVHTYNTTGDVSVAQRAAEAVLRGPQGHVGEAVAELERRRDAIFAALPGWPLVARRVAGRCCSTWSRWARRPRRPRRRCSRRRRRDRHGRVGRGRRGAYVRFVFSAEPVPRLTTLGERLARTGLGDPR